ncbi:hypothetical protein O9G_003692 [Rozella allomycis CSF55]|uniref:Ral GTPase-activating protein subunit alpha/beta N-terminal domain-containing protein n=1 Tax=Rozella allomycis (strain CSF55) TaxID=988480 RepID=A0A075B3J9_ROZAC|nr:hypothetical protein O9G_003692 [Rozella allomycis CSF55]|eukprot:EPZ35433.1 hypothetical protein O9G_003692 [Rozella allomycis CSF55]
METTSLVEMEQFYKENEQLIFSLCIESYLLRYEKLKKTKETKTTIISSKDFSEVLKLFKVLQLWVNFCLQLVNDSVYSAVDDWFSQLENVLRQLLTYKGHVKIRTSGLQIIMSVLKTCGEKTPKNLSDLFMSSLYQIVGDEPFIPAISHENLETDMKTSLEDIFEFLCNESMDDQSLEYIFSFIKLLMNKAFNDKNDSSIKEVFVKYFIGWIFHDEKEFINKHTQFFGDGISNGVSINMLAKLMEGSMEELHRVVYYGLSCPFSKIDAIEIVINFLEILCNKELEYLRIRTCFGEYCHREDMKQDIMLNEAEQGNLRNELNDSGDNVKELFNSCLRTYLGYVFQIFDGRPSKGLTKEQLKSYKKAFSFIHSIFVESHLIPSNKYSIITDPTQADEICDILIHTVYGVWIRSGILNDEIWSFLNRSVVQVTKWHAVVSQWKKSILYLTRRYFIDEFEVDFVSLYMQFNAGKKNSMVPSMSQEFSNSDGIVSLKGLFASCVESLDDVEENLFRDFNIKVTDTLWFKVYNLIGNINDIQRPEIHSESLSCIASLVEILLFLKKHNYRLYFAITVTGLNHGKL